MSTTRTVPSRKAGASTKRKVRILAAAIAGILCAGPVAAASTIAEGRILVAPKAGLSEANFDEVLRKNNGRSLGKLKNIGVHIVEVPPQAEQAVIRALSHNKHIEFAEPDMLVEPVIIPNDPKFYSAWHLPKIRATEVWPNYVGNGVTVAILDTGVDSSHLDLQANLVSGWNSVSLNSDTSDINGHGTMVAGTVAAESDNGLGVTSVAWNATLMPVRVTNQSSGSAYWSDIARGITWAADNGARVANISYSVTNSSSVISAASYMRNKGGVVVVSAGNTGGNTETKDSTAIITVSATDSGDTRTSWSSYGEDVDYAAPGSGIWTTKDGGSYGAVSGTSFSSPITAAVVALMMSANPSLTPDEIEAILQQTSVDLGTADWDMYYGWGRIDAAEAVSMAANAESSDIESPSTSILSPTSGSVSGLTPVSVEATDNFGIDRVELYANGSLVGTDNSGTSNDRFDFSWDTTLESDGTAELQAVAYDQSGNMGDSTTVSVTVRNMEEESDVEPPLVVIAYPADGSSVSGNVAISASASDNQQVSTLNLYVDGNLKCSGTTSVTCNWNTRKATGSHEIRATATDVSGNNANASVSVIIGSDSNSGSVKGKGRSK